MVETQYLASQGNEDLQLMRLQLLRLYVLGE